MHPSSARLSALIALGLALAATAAAVGCARAAPAEPSPTQQQGSEAGPVIEQPDRLFALDDLVAAGWKKSKQLDAELIPEAVEVWYGFYNQKDIEVRVYASHADALNHGARSAEEITEASPYVSDFWKGSQPNYRAYTIRGNVVLLCQFDMNDCQALTANVK